MKSRASSILAFSSVVLIFGLLFILYGYDKTWKLWNIPTMSPHFADVRVITSGLESRALGYDPLINNPQDPWLRRTNYPRIWQSLYLLGINQSHTTYIGVIFIFAFLFGVSLVLPHANIMTIALVTAAIMSPAVLLGVERGNNDLLVFFLIAVATVTVERWSVLSAGAILLGFILKLFPILGCAVLLRVRKELFLKYMVIFIIVSALYIYLTFSDILLVSAATPRSFAFSYGLNGFWMMSDKILNSTMGFYIKILSYLTVILAFFWACTALIRCYTQPMDETNPVYLNAFRAGCAIYIGTFLIGNNFDYRLMFLIFTVPQLIAWARCNSLNAHPLRVSIGSVIILVTEYLSFWYLLFVKVTAQLPYAGLVLFIIGEICNWIVFIGLLYLFFWSMPDWAKGHARKILLHSTQQLVGAIPLC